MRDIEAQLASKELTSFLFSRFIWLDKTMADSQWILVQCLESFYIKGISLRLFERARRTSFRFDTPLRGKVSDWQRMMNRRVRYSCFKVWIEKLTPLERAVVFHLAYQLTVPGDIQKWIGNEFIGEAPPPQWSKNPFSLKLSDWIKEESEKVSLLSFETIKDHQVASF